VEKVAANLHTFVTHIVLSTGTIIHLIYTLFGAVRWNWTHVTTEWDCGLHVWHFLYCRC